MFGFLCALSVNMLTVYGSDKLNIVWNVKNFRNEQQEFLSPGTAIILLTENARRHETTCGTGLHRLIISKLLLDK